MPTIVSLRDNTKVSNNERTDKTDGRILRILRPTNNPHNRYDHIANILVNKLIKRKTCLLIISVLINKINKKSYHVNTFTFFDVQRIDCTIDPNYNAYILSRFTKNLILI